MLGVIFLCQTFDLIFQRFYPYVLEWYFPERKVPRARDLMNRIIENRME